MIRKLQIKIVSIIMIIITIMLFAISLLLAALIYSGFGSSLLWLFAPGHERVIATSAILDELAQTWETPKASYLTKAPKTSVVEPS